MIPASAQDLHHVAEAEAVDDAVALILDVEPHVQGELALDDLLGQQLAGNLNRPLLHRAHRVQISAFRIVDQAGAVPQVKMIPCHMQSFQASLRVGDPAPFLQQRPFFANYQAGVSRS